jgi:hypothetical protein
VKHNDAAPQSRLSKARENVGTVQFHDKWLQYFLGSGWSYGRTPRYLMQHFPVDLEFFDRLALPLGLNATEEKTRIGRQEFWVHRDVRLDRNFMVPSGIDAWEIHKAEIIAEWEEASGLTYEGYNWGRIPYAVPGE